MKLYKLALGLLVLVLVSCARATVPTSTGSGVYIQEAPQVTVQIEETVSSLPVSKYSDCKEMLWSKEVVTLENLAIYSCQTMLMALTPGMGLSYYEDGKAMARVVSIQPEYMTFGDGRVLHSGDTFTSTFNGKSFAWFTIVEIDSVSQRASVLVLFDSGVGIVRNVYSMLNPIFGIQWSNLGAYVRWLDGQQIGYIKHVKLDQCIGVTLETGKFASTRLEHTDQGEQKANFAFNKPMAVGDKLYLHTFEGNQIYVGALLAVQENRYDLRENSAFVYWTWGPDLVADCDRG